MGLETLTGLLSGACASMDGLSIPASASSNLCGQHGELLAEMRPDMTGLVGRSPMHIVEKNCAEGPDFPFWNS